MYIYLMLINKSRPIKTKIDFRFNPMTINLIFIYIMPILHW